MAKFKCIVQGVKSQSLLFKGSLLKFNSPVIETEEKDFIEFLKKNRNYEEVKPKAKSKEVKQKSK